MDKIQIKSFIQFMNEEENENLESQIAKYIAIGLNVATQAHIYHLLISGEGSSAHHLALKTFYEGLPTAIDTLAEQSLSELTVPTTTVNVEINFAYSDELLDKTLQEFEELSNKLLSAVNITEESPFKLSILNSITIIQDLISALKYQLKLQ